MASPSTFRAVVSGRRRGAVAAILRALLRVVEVPYTWAVRRRNRGYDSGKKPIHQVDVPVVSVGNLTLGGTGKTPTVQWLARFFADRGVKTAIVSRGYRAGAAGRNDEALVLAQNLPEVPHVQNPDRVAGARQAIKQHGCRLVLLDDGFQHRRLHRDLDIVLLDACEPFGFDHVFPRGTLREPLDSLRRADVVMLSRADMIDEVERAEVRRRARQLAPEAIWIEARHAPQELAGTSGTQESLDSLAGCRVAAFCGIGNPAGFQHTIQTLGCQLVAWREFADHHAYSTRDVEQLGRWAETAGADAVLCTQKDLVKFDVESLAGRPLWAVTVGIEMLTGQKELVALLEPLARARLDNT